MRIFLTFLCFFLAALPAYALPAPDPETFTTLGENAVIMEADTGAVLYSKNADERMPTSSMSKVMTMYLVFEALEKGALHLDQEVWVSKKAWQVEGSRMFLRHAQRVKVSDLIQGVIVQSGNDAAVALAEALTGAEDSFAALMNSKAQALGMKNSHFVNATGLPDEEHYSTAHDLALLTRALIRDFPQYYHYFSEKSFTFNKIKQGNRNPLLYTDPSVDGVKTGHAQDAGYGLIASAKRDERRVITVINGLKNNKLRGSESERLLDLAFHGFKTYRIVEKGKELGDALLWLGQAPTVSVVAAEDVSLVLSEAAHDKITIEKLVAKETEAPIRKGQLMGKLIVKGGENMDPVEVKLLAAHDVLRLGFIPATFAKVKRAWQEALK
ncbi:MAG: D-alanyl-D-alanine carboxypeptidase family protein [Bdellovibrionales bacterium]